MIARIKFELSSRLYNLLHGGQKMVAVMSCDRWKGKILDDRLVVLALQRGGMRAKIISWQDAKVNYDKIDGLVIGSMWGYQNYLEELKEWFSRVGGKKMLNPIEVILANYDKEKQFRLLNEHGIAAVPAQMIAPGNEDVRGAVVAAMAKFGSDVVVKPSISGSGQDTFLISEQALKNACSLDGAMPNLETINREKTLMVQPFMPEIDGGELAVIYIGGKLSHAVMRYPHIFSDEGVEHEVGVNQLEPEVLQICQKILAIPEYKDAAYARLDFVKTNNGYLVMEVEMFEPQLFYSRIEERDKALSSIVEQIKQRV